MSGKLRWWEAPAIVRDPAPHIRESEILLFMPENLEPEWQVFIRGSQVLALEDGEIGIYPHDFFRFLKSQNLC
jgi:hypothetical protein